MPKIGIWLVYPLCLSARLWLDFHDSAAASTLLSQQRQRLTYVCNAALSLSLRITKEQASPIFVSVIACVTLISIEVVDADQCSLVFHATVRTHGR